MGRIHSAFKSHSELQSGHATLSINVELQSSMLPLGILLVTPFTPSLTSGNSCFSEGFLGNYGDAGSTLSVLSVTNQDCLNLWNSELDSARYAPVPEPGRQLVWLEKASVDERLGSSSLDAFFDALSASEYGPGLEQQVMEEQVQVPSGGYEIHYHTETAALVSVDTDAARVIDTFLPPFWKSRLLPTESVSYIPVPEDAAKAVRDILSNLKFDPIVAAVVGNISIPQIKKDIRFLTGEDESSGIVSRHSFHPDTRIAAKWLKEAVEGTGATCRLSPFLTGFAPNVIW